MVVRCPLGVLPALPASSSAVIESAEGRSFVRCVIFACLLMLLVDLARLMAGGFDVVNEGVLAPWWQYVLVTGGAIGFEWRWRRGRST